ncbi:hypothetical protein W909_08810 [Dickeya zeae EC1]|nr:hypothetical protein W909_08810 [Dickeya zeae EC1]
MTIPPDNLTDARFGGPFFAGKPATVGMVVLLGD